MKAKFLLITTCLIPMISFAAITKEANTESQQKQPSEKSAFDKLSEKGRGETKESADSGRTGGDRNTATLTDK